jgi:glycosyltransferase involved in cell wall biosynthesis/ADP-heptose:LPS heptosyltransferase
MRLVIDLQGAQTESRFRGIGRYSLALALEMARLRGEHEVIVALSGLFPETIEPLRAAFADVLPAQNVVVWDAPHPVRAVQDENRARREVAERMREAFLASLNPDWVLVTSLFEGLGDDAVTSLGKFSERVPTAVILYDLIPLLNPDENFRKRGIYKEWYADKINSIRKARLLLAISDSAMGEAVTGLAWPAHRVVNVSGACEDWFRELGLGAAAKTAAATKVGITRPFLMYTGGADDRKNLERLIQAFSKLPDLLRHAHQLAMVGKMPRDLVEKFQNEARRCGLGKGEVVFTGYVSDDDLLRLYNSCTGFVFPSLHEGFGLPPLEAMRCGAPVIAASASSLPEVIGNPDALFDPKSVASIRDKMERLLTDPGFRDRLAAAGKLHAKTFSWASSARLAWDALLRTPARPGLALPGLYLEKTSLFASRPRKILLVKLDHLGDFLLAEPALKKLRSRYPDAEIDIVVGSWNRDLAESTGIFRRVFVLDYFRKKSSVTPKVRDAEVDDLVHRMPRYDIAIDLRRQADSRFFLGRVNANVRVAYTSFDAELDSTFEIVLPAQRDVAFETTSLNRTSAAAQILKLVDTLPGDASDFLPAAQARPARDASSGGIAIFPLAGNAVKEWGLKRFAALAKTLADEPDVTQVNVYFGSSDEAARFPLREEGKVRFLAGLEMSALVESVSANAVCVANNSFGAHLGSRCGCFVIGVYGGHETPAEWGPIYGDGYVLHTREACSPCHIASRSDCRYGMACLERIRVEHVAKVALAAHRKRLGDPSDWEAFDTADRESYDVLDELIRSLARLTDSASRADRLDVANRIARNHRPSSADKQLLVDISELVMRDARTGIQRVVRAILSELLRNPPNGYAVRPVYATGGKRGFRYANAFVRRFGARTDMPAHDEAVETWAGDIFLGLDLNYLVLQQQEWLAERRRRGLNVQFVVYDLLPITHPWAFDSNAQTVFPAWLQAASNFDALIGISEDVAEQARQWLRFNGLSRIVPLRIGHFHLGADVQSSVPTQGVDEEQRRMLDAASRRPTFLMVGTLEPRKGHALALSAMEQLWDAGCDANLLIIGKNGWGMADLSRRLLEHPRRGANLFWCESGSDEFLEAAYAASSALLAASEGEGFGLPLVEAARHELAIIARDLAVFREVAGDHAAYFPQTADASSVAAFLKEWLTRFERGMHPKSAGIRWLSWRDSAQSLVEQVMGRAPAREWLPDGVLRFNGSDPRMHTHLGIREGRRVSTTGREGHLFFGPYVALSPGSYECRVIGSVQAVSPEDHMDIVCDSGRKKLAVVPISEVDANQPTTVRLRFNLARPETDIEVRFWVGDATVATVERIEIESIDPETEAQPEATPPEPALQATETTAK